MANRRSNRKIVRLILSVLGILLLISLATCSFVFMISRAPQGIAPEGELFTVKNGSSLNSISRELKQAGLIRSEQYFILISRITRTDNELKFGTYRILPSMTASDILRLLVSGKQALIKITIPEGLSLKQVAALFESAGYMSSISFLAAASDASLLAELEIPASSVEGFLFPETYYLPKEYPARDLIRILVRTFRQKVFEKCPEAKTLTSRELFDRLTLASIVEREYRIPVEAPIMASVFYNRLRINMALQSCATVVYVITEKLGKPHPALLFDRDLKIIDPYNTYINRGLPPGPICSPGLTAICAVFYPVVSKYLYFRLVNETTGEHHFSLTLEEHNQAANLITKRPGGK